jgi:hypothetical protein
LKNIPSKAHKIFVINQGLKAYAVEMGMPIVATNLPEYKRNLVTTMGQHMSKILSKLWKSQLPFITII